MDNSGSSNASDQPQQAQLNNLFGLLAMVFGGEKGGSGQGYTTHSEDGE
jgi:hypothetical protein